jgi:hypothetical protein
MLHSLVAIDGAFVADAVAVPATVVNAIAEDRGHRHLSQICLAGRHFLDLCPFHFEDLERAPEDSEKELYSWPAYAPL